MVSDQGKIDMFAGDGLQVTVMELRQRGNFSKPPVSVSDAQTSCRY